MENVVDVCDGSVIVVIEALVFVDNVKNDNDDVPVSVWTLRDVADFILRFVLVEVKANFIRVPNVWSLKAMIPLVGTVILMDVIPAVVVDANFKKVVAGVVAASWKAT